MQDNDNKLSLFGLICLVVGSIIGGGLFDLMRDMAQGAGPGAIIISWIIAGMGAISLGLTFKNLTMKRPDLNAGMYSYAKACFGNYMGFNATLGYWFCTILGNVGYAALLMSTFGFFFPQVFRNGQNLTSVIVASIFTWSCVFLILKGIKMASFVNTIITVAKMIPIGLFIVIMMMAFKWNVFTQNFWATPTGGFNWYLVATQVGSTLAVIFWCIDGIESANVFAASAKKRSDVGKATVIGISTIILIYALVTLLSFGTMNRYHMANLSEPAMGHVLESVVGPWGAVLVNLGIIISLLGGMISWEMITSTVPQIAAEHHDFPKFFGELDVHGVQRHSLITSGIMIEIFILCYLVEKDAYITCYTIASTTILACFVQTALYQVKYTWQHRFNGKLDWQNLIIGVLALCFTSFGLLSIVPKHFMGVSEILLLPLVFTLGIPMYWYLRKHENHAQSVFTRNEAIFAMIMTILAAGTLIKMIV